MRTKTKDRRTPSRETQRGVAYEVARRTCALPDGSLRVDWRRLDDDEAIELVSLTESDAALSQKEQVRWEELVGRASGEDGLFARLRDAAAISREAKELRRQLVRRPVSRDEEVTLLREIGEQLAGGFLYVGHVGLLALVLASLERGEPVGGNGRVEEGVLVVDSRRGIAKAVNGDGALDGWREGLKQLERNGWLDVERRGPEWRLGLGVRAKRALRAPK